MKLLDGALYILLLYVSFAMVGLPLSRLYPERLSLATRLLLAPSLGMALTISLLTLYVNVPLLAFPPRIFLTSLVALAFFIERYFHTKESKKNLNADKEDWLLFLVPAVYFLFQAFFYARNGIFMLSGGEDELAYAQGADHLLKFQNTGHVLDTLVPRMGHLLRDEIILPLSYVISIRRGAEFLLASSSQLLGLNSFQAFAILCSFLTLNLGLCLGFLGRKIYGLSPKLVVLLQLLVLTCCHVFLLQIQGSLANISSLCFFLLSLSMGSMLLRAGKGSALLAALLVSATILFYSEVSLILCVAPLTLALFYDLWREKALGKRSFWGKTFPIFLVGVILFTHLGLYSFFRNIWDNFRVVSTAGASKASLDPAHYNPTLAGIYGLASIFTETAWNEWLHRILIKHRLLLSLLVAAWALLLSVLSLRIRKYKVSALGFACAIVLILGALLYGKGELLRFARLNQYFLLPALLCSFALAFEKTLAKSLRMALLTALGLFFAINLFNFFSYHERLFGLSALQDKRIKRLNPEAPAWKNLRRLLSEDGAAPVMLEDFGETPLPHAIATMIEPHESFLGPKMRAYWDFLPKSGSPGHSTKTQYFRLQRSSFERDRHWVYPEWRKVFSELESRSLWTARPLASPVSGSLSVQYHFGEIFSLSHRQPEAFLDLSAQGGSSRLKMRRILPGPGSLEIFYRGACRATNSPEENCQSMGNGHSRLSLPAPALGAERVLPLDLRSIKILRYQSRI
jgi:hypothetical protein